MQVPEGAALEVDEHRRNIQRELNDIDGVNQLNEISACKAAENARAIDAVVIGALTVVLKNSDAFDAMVSILKTWIESGNRHREKRRVVIKRPDDTVLQFDGYNLQAIDLLPNAGGKS